MVVSLLIKQVVTNETMNKSGPWKLLFELLSWPCFTGFRSWFLTYIAFAPLLAMVVDLPS